MNNTVPSRPLIGIGLGGLCEGWLPPVLHLYQTKVMRFSRILLIDGKTFTERNRERQHFNGLRPKAEERCALWQSIYPDAPLDYCVAFVDATNVSRFIGDGAIVLLSPDNHATRKVVSDHVQTLHTTLLICGCNDGINAERGEDGTEGCVIVHCKVQGKDLTPPITRHHPEIAEPEDRLPNDLGCTELAAGEPQLVATNLMVGHTMALLLHRYCAFPIEEAAQLPEVWVNSRTGAVVRYGIKERSMA